MSVQSGLREKARLAKEKGEQQWLKDKEDELRLKKLNDHLDHLVHEEKNCQSRSNYLNSCIQKLRDENRRAPQLKLNVPDYFEKVETIREMVEIEMSTENPEHAKATDLL